MSLKKIVIFASGSGSSAENIFQKFGDNNNINIPPIIPITHEDYNYNSNISVQENKHKFKLYRSKPLNNNMNIYNTMNLNNIMNIEKEDIINTELDKTDDLTNDDNEELKYCISSSPKVS